MAVRVFDNAVAGTLSSSLTSGATTMNSAGLADLSTISGSDWSYITLDPDGSGNGPEIVKVTAHSASATSATITRGQDGTSAASHTSGTNWVAGIVADDMNTLVADSASTASVTISNADPRITLTDTSTNADCEIIADNSGILYLSADANNEETGSQIQFRVDGADVGEFQADGDLFLENDLDVDGGRIDVGQSPTDGTLGGVVALQAGSNGSGNNARVENVNIFTADFLKFSRTGGTIFLVDAATSLYSKTVSTSVRDVQMDSSSVLGYVSSSARTKKDVETITPEEAAGIVEQLRPVRFVYIDDWAGETQVGFIAEEVDEVLPEVVHRDPEDSSVVDGLNYKQMVSVLAGAVQDLQRRVAELEGA